MISNLTPLLLIFCIIKTVRLLWKFADKTIRFQRRHLRLQITLPTPLPPKIVKNLVHVPLAVSWWSGHRDFGYNHQSDLCLSILKTVNNVFGGIWIYIVRSKKQNNSLDVFLVFTFRVFFLGNADYWQRCNGYYYFWFRDCVHK